MWVNVKNLLRGDRIRLGNKVVVIRKVYKYYYYQEEISDVELHYAGLDSNHSIWCDPDISFQTFTVPSLE